jgi:3-oxoacyl-[acyl-carrier-protein] synthase II
MTDRAVVTGMGAVSSLGTSVAANWAALVDGRSGVGPITGSDARGFTGLSAAQLVGPEPGALGIDARNARIMGRPGLMLLQTGREALAQAKLGTSDAEPERIGFFAALGMVDPQPDDLRRAVIRSRGRDGIDYERFFADAYREIYPLWPLAMLNNVGFCVAAQLLGVRGENAVFSPGADAAVVALAEAAAAVLGGRADAALAAGASEGVSAASVARSRLARGWDRSKSAAAPGEAAGVLVVEPESRARSRNAQALAVVAGWGFAFGAEGEQAAADATRQAIERARIEPCDVDAVLLDGEGGGEDGAAERATVAGVFAGGGNPVMLTSRRSIGHALAGGAALDALFAVLMVSTGEVPAALRAEGADQSHGAGQRAGWFQARPRHVLVNARSWGGHAASLLVAAAE